MSKPGTPWRERLGGAGGGCAVASVKVRGAPEGASTARVRRWGGRLKGEAAVSAERRSLRRRRKRGGERDKRIEERMPPVLKAKDHPVEEAVQAK